MSVTKTSDFLASQIASSVGNPGGLDSGPGMYVVWQNARYLLAYRNDRYVAWDVSVYQNGQLVTDQNDVYINAVWTGVKESSKEILDASATGLKSLGQIAMDLLGATDSALQTLNVILKLLPWIIGLAILFVFLHPKEILKKI